MSELSRLDAIMPLTLEERGALSTLVELAEVRDGFVPDQERWLAGWMQCSVRKWRLIRAALFAKGQLQSSDFAGQQGFVLVSASNQSRVTREPTMTREEKNAGTETKFNDFNEASRTHEARVRDNLPKLVSTGVGGGGVGEPEAAEDWPEGDCVALLVEAAASPWLDPTKSQGLVLTAGRLAAWKRRGASWAAHVVPVVTTLARANGEPISTWKFFEAALGRAIKASRDEMLLPEGVIRLPRATGPPRTIDEKVSASWDEAIRRISAEDG